MTIEDFKLDSVKILNEDVVIKYHTSTDNATQVYEEKERKPHPDFVNTLEQFLPYYNNVFAFTDYNTRVKGIAIKKATKLQLTGMIMTVTGSLCSLNTPFFEMDNDDLDFTKEQLDKLIENVRIESWKYIYERKSSQQELELFTETEKEEE